MKTSTPEVVFLQQIFSKAANRAKVCWSMGGFTPVRRSGNAERALDLFARLGSANQLR
jgi:hypothetical protein